MIAGEERRTVNLREETLGDIERFFQNGRKWLKESHEKGLGGQEFCQSYSSLMDQVIRRLFRRGMGSAGEGEGGTGLSLLAMGGYGREELSPFSDIDLLLLHVPAKGKDLDKQLPTLLHPLWDWGLTVGYTVQTPKDGLRAARKDLDQCLSFLDSRWITGDRGIFLKWQEDFFRALLANKSEKVIWQIKERMQSRHAHYGDSVFILEPEIKEGKGGLRDYHSAFWAAKIKHCLRFPEDLGEGGLFSEKEWRTYTRALGFLWRVRNQLHYFHGRREDRLSFEDQEAVAGALGYRGESVLLATESFLKDYFTQALQIYHLSTNLLERCWDEKSLSPKRWGSDGPPEITPGFFLFHGKIAMTEPSLFERNPFHLWKALAMVHAHGIDLDPLLKETISGQLEVVNERFRTAEESVKAFLSFFDQPGHLYEVLEVMHETGFLRKFVPEFERIYCHVQYDRYHIYPVDVHSFYAVREIEMLEKEEGRKSWPLLGELLGEIKNRQILKLAALIHDLGKAEGSSHALRGERIALAIGERLQLPPEKIDLLRFLVREHLTFVEIAQRRDLNDENLIFRFAQTVGAKENLMMLYLLCFADLRAVGPSAWTAWKDTLMRELFIKTMHLLEKGEGLGKEAQDRVIRIQREVTDLLTGQVAGPKIMEYLVNVPSRHYTVHDSRAIGQQILMAEKLVDQIVVMDGEEKPEEGCAEIIVVARDEPGLFAKICGVMTANFLNILSAQISTWENGLAVDIFRVENMISDALFRTHRWTKLQEDLEKALEGKVSVRSLVQATIFPLFHRFPLSRTPTKVEIDNEASDFYTVIEIYTHDRPGLLYHVTQKIFEMGLNLYLARISTKVDQVVDVFYIQDLSGAKLADGNLTVRVKKEILEGLDKI